MTTQPARGVTNLEDALYAFSLADPDTYASLLEELIRQYPQHAQKLTDFAIELALDDLRGDEDEQALIDVPCVNSMVSQAMSKFHNHLYALKAATLVSQTKVASQVRDIFSGLDRNKLRTFGSNLNANTIFAVKLRDRLIDPDTITNGFKKKLQMN